MTLSAGRSGSSILFVGLGNMGWPMAANLVSAQRNVVAHDADFERESRFAKEHGCDALRTRDHLRDVNAVVLMLPTSAIVREVLIGDSNLAGELPSDAVIIDMSSSDPTDTVSLATQLGKQGLRTVDAPVSGGVARAQQGTLTIMMGADDENAAAIATDIVAPMSDRIFRTGRVGTGHAMKALNNYVAAASFTAATEAAAVGEHFGLTPEVVVGVLNASSGRSFITETTMCEAIAGSYSTGFALGLLNKDVNIAVQLAAAAREDAPVCGEVSRKLNAATQGLGFAVDHSRAYDFWKSGSPLDRTEALT